MEKKESIQRREVVLTARIPTNLHTAAKTKMASRRGESFQDVITAAIERYVQSSEGVGGSAEIRSNPHPVDLIASLHAELSGKSPGSSGEKAISLLGTYTRSIREILDNIDRAFGVTPTGDHAATLGSDIRKADNDTEFGSARELGGGRSGEREAGDTARTRDVIANAERVNQEARRTIEDAGRHSGGDRVPRQEKKHPRKKAG